MGEAKAENDKQLHMWGAKILALFSFSDVDSLSHF